MNGGEGCTFAPAGTSHAGFIDLAYIICGGSRPPAVSPTYNPSGENGQLITAQYTAVTLIKLAHRPPIARILRWKLGS